MSLIADQNYLCAQQYNDSSKLDARIALHLRYSVNSYGWFRWYFDHLDLPVDAAVLDIGCGPALLWCENLARVKPGWQVCLADLSPGMVAQADANLTAAGGADPRFRFETADIQTLPFDDGAFDAVLANHMLYHVPDRTRALAEIQRVLRPGGRLFAATNGAGHLREMAKLIEPFVTPDADMVKAKSCFGLENGAAQLAPWFDPVERLDYVDSLRVTDAGDLLAYILTTRQMFWEADSVGSIAALTRAIEERLARGGVIAISKSSGLFIGWRR